MAAEDTLTITYHVTDPEARIVWPAPAQGRTDGLWQHTCFEAFIGSTSGPAYAEFNLAPSGAWAAYAFDDYRTGMRDLALPVNPQMAEESGLWQATIPLAGLDALLGPAPWRLAITAVIEATDGARSYWSLAHPSGKPDFHHPDCFAARLG
ncbi:MAG: DOMON-like domain-containing protein [Blastomonas sp.]|uniref:DOMON-like domain-containing protein n=1 Tax=unclassified Blastomonas TaxID=2626550 RepID=UPI0008368AE0|nr:DOMON-like domain-containing protein [Blastomonas sp.]MCH2239220.1 DOMON-like domain-containing protein [Blastomonas sp.]